MSSSTFPRADESSLAFVGEEQLVVNLRRDVKVVRMDGEYDNVDDNGIHQECDEYLADNDDDSNDHDDDVDNYNEDDL